MSRTAANLLLLTAGAIWGMGFVVQQTAMEDIGPMLFIALRFFLAGFSVLPFALAEIKKQGGTGYVQAVKTNLRSYLYIGIAFFLGIASQQIGLIETTVTNAGFLTAVYVVVVPFLMITVLRVPQPIVIWPAAGLALAGIYLLSGGDLTTLKNGDLLIAGCTLFWAIHLILTARVGQATGLPVTMATTQFFITSAIGFFIYVALLPTSLGEGIPTTQQFMGALPEVLYSGTIAAGLGFTLQAVGQRYTSESAAAILLSTESLFAALMGAIFLGERMGIVGYAGCGMIFAAILIVELMPRKKSVATPA